MNRKELIDVFQRIDDALSAPQTLCVIGASAILAYGHSVRQTDDIDVWRPASRINDRQIARAAGRLPASWSTAGPTFPRASTCS